MESLTPERLSEAILMSTAHHSSQVDKSGVPYILHPLRVMLRVYEGYPSLPNPDFTLEEIVIAAVLHDLVEDTEVTLEDIRKIFGSKVAEIVDGVSRRKGESYRAFILRANLNTGSRLLKTVDIQDNLSRIHQLPENERIIEVRYKLALKVLCTPQEYPTEAAS